MDIATIINLLALGNGISALIFLVFIHVHKKSDISLKYFTVGKIIQTFTWLLFIFNQDNLTPFVMTFGNVFQYFGLMIEVLGFAFSFSKPSKRNIIIGFVACSLWVILFGVFSSNIILRVLVSSFMFFGLYLSLFVCIIKAKQHFFIVNLVGWLSLLFAIVHLSRGVYGVLTYVELDIYSNILIQGLVGYVYIIVTFTFPVFLLLIVIEKDNQRLSKLNATKNKFFRIIGHDLKAPFHQLYHIAQIIEFKKKDITSDDLESLGEAIKTSSIRTSKLLDDILSWAVAESETIMMQPETIYVKQRVEENMELLKSKAEQKGIVFINNTSSSAKVYCDPNMFDSILRNLLSNSIKFSFNNSNVEMACSGNTKSWTISVKDVGVGIERKNISKLFKIDSDFSTLGTEEEQGTGIGLSLCEEFVEKNKGEIWVESVVGEGTTFYFSLPKVK